MPFDRKTSLAFQILGRDDTAPLTLQTVGPNLDVFFRPRSPLVLIGRGPSYLVFDRRVSREDAIAAFHRGVRTAPQGAATDIRPGIPLVRPVTPAQPKTTGRTAVKKAAVKTPAKQKHVAPAAPVQTVPGTTEDFSELFRYGEQLQAAA